MHIGGKKENWALEDKVVKVVGELPSVPQRASAILVTIIDMQEKTEMSITTQLYSCDGQVKFVSYVGTISRWHGKVGKKIATITTSRVLEALTANNKKVI